MRPCPTIESSRLLYLLSEHSRDKRRGVGLTRHDTVDEMRRVAPGPAFNKHDAPDNWAKMPGPPNDEAPLKIYRIFR